MMSNLQFAWTTMPVDGVGAVHVAAATKRDGPDRSVWYLTKRVAPGQACMTPKMRSRALPRKADPHRA